MKKFKSIIITSLLLIFTVGTSTSNVNASENISNDTKIAKEIIDLNDSSWDEFLKNVDLSKGVHSESYIPIAETKEAQSKIPKSSLKPYTYNEYLQAKSKNPKYQYLYLASWVKVGVEVFPLFNSNKASVLASFEWLTNPQAQFDRDSITISSDTNYVFEGAEGIVNGTSFLNKDCPSVYATYSYSNNPGRFKLDGLGNTFNFPLSDKVYSSKIQALGSTECNKYFERNGKTGVYRTKGCPKAVIGSYIKRSNTSTVNGRIVVTYGHKQLTFSGNPSVSINANGVASFSLGVAGKKTYDTVSSAFNYKWGYFIE